MLTSQNGASGCPCSKRPDRASRPILKHLNFSSCVALGLSHAVRNRCVCAHHQRADIACAAKAIDAVSPRETDGERGRYWPKWLREAATQVSQIEAVLMADYHISRGQLDGLWAHVGNKGEKSITLKPKRLASAGARPCSTWIADSVPHVASPKPKAASCRIPSRRCQAMTLAWSWSPCIKWAATCSILFGWTAAD